MAAPDLLLAVDVQRGFRNAHTEHVAPAIARFCAAHPVPHRVFAMFENPGPGGPFVERLGWDAFTGPPDWESDPRVEGVPTALFAHRGYSLFDRASLDRVLNMSGARSVMLVGVDTDVCVLHTALGLFDRGYRTTVASDLVASGGGPQSHAAALCILRRTLGADAVAPAARLVAAESAGAAA